MADKAAHTAALDIIRNEFTSSKRSAIIANLPQLVLFAEKVLKDNGSVDIAVESIQLYLSMEPPTNQFLIRAYLCLANAYKPESPAESNKLQDSLKYISKAVSIAKKTSCYHFLVYNSSVILWRISRPFHVPQHYSLLTTCVQNVVKALEEIQYKDDYEWRLQLMRLLVKCLLANYQRDDAIRVEQSALHMARKHVPHMLMPMFKQMVLDGIGDVKLIEKELKRNPHLLVLAKVWKLQSAMFKRPISSFDAETKLMRILSMVTDKEATPTPIPSDMMTQILIEIGELAMNYSLLHITELCTSKIESIEKLELLIRMELLKIQLTANKLPSGDDYQLSYTRHAIKTRCLSIEKCYDLFVRCIREGNLEEVERISVVLWNISLPLLQPSLSHHVVKSFTLATDLLEKTNSLMYGVRSMLHFELAKVLYSQDKQQTATDHIDKAIALDHQEGNKDYYMHFKHCLSMKHNLYTDQEKALDKALSMIEQIKGSSAGEYDKDGLQQLLISIVNLIDPPDNFSTTLNYQTSIDPDSEDNITEQDLFLHKLSDKSNRYSKYKERAETFHKTIMNGYDSTLKFLILCDVCKLARKYHIWDVALLSALYCTQNDDGHWTSRAFTPSVSKDFSKLKVAPTDSKIGRGSSDASSSTSLRTPDHTVSLKTPDHTHSTPLYTLPLPYSYCEVNTDKLQVVALAETFCVLGECLVQALIDEGLKLGGVASRPDTVPEDNQQWLKYSEWIQVLSVDAHRSFVRCAELGSTLYEQWLINNAIVYIWNYNLHNFQQKQWKGLVEPLRGVLQTLKGQSLSMRDNALICRVTGVLANGLIQSSDAKPVDLSGKANNEQQTKKTGTANRTGSRGSARSKKRREGSGRNMVTQDSVTILKEAVEICEFAASECLVDTPLNISRTVLQCLVTSKQLLQQPINMKSILNDKSTNGTQEEGWLTHYQAIVNTEMHHAHTIYGVYDFPNSLTIKEVYDLINECDWQEFPLLELELLTILAHSAHMKHQHDEVITCCEKVLQTKYTSSEKFRSVCNSLYGQSLVLISGNRSSAVIKRAIDCFNDSIRLGGDTCNYEDVITNCKHAWNTLILLDTSTNKGSGEGGLKESTLNILINVLKRTERNGDNEALVSEDDSRLLTNMIQSVMNMYYSDKDGLSQGIEVIDSLLRLSPKQYQRMLYERKMIFKSKLGRNIEGDMLRFQEDPPAVVAALWFSCAQESTNQNQQYMAYRNAIKFMQKSEDGSCLLIDYIIQFCIWLRTNNHSSSIVINHLKWARHELTRDHAHLSITDLNQLLILHIMMYMSSEDQCKYTYICQSVGYCVRIWRDILNDKKHQSNECPDTLKEWLGFIPSKEVLECISAQNALSTDDESLDTSILSKHTLTHAGLTLYYLEQLYTELYHTGQYMLVLPVLYYQQLISTTITNDQLLKQLSTLRLSNIFGMLIDENSTRCHEYFNNATTDGFILPENVIRMNGHVTSRHVTNDADFAQSNWLNIIDLLISQGQFTTCRDMIHTIQSAGVTEMLQTTVKLLELKLSAMEGKQEYCIDILNTFECKCIDTLKDWTLLLDTVHYIASSHTKYTGSVCRLLYRILRNVSSCDLMSCDCRYLIGLIHLRLLQIITDVDKELEKEVLMNLEALNSIGCYHVVCVHILLSLIKLRVSSTDGTVSDTDLIQSIEHCKRAIEIVQSSLLQSGSIEHTDSPMYKLMMKCQLQYCKLLLITYKQYVTDKKKVMNAKLYKPSITKLIDKYTTEVPSYTEDQQKLQSIQCIAADEGITLLSSILQATGNREIKTECLLYVGKFFQYISFSESPDPPLQWTTPPIMNHDQVYSTLSQVMRQEQADEDTVKEQRAVNALISCANVLMECVSHGLASRQLDIVMQASLILVNIFGSCDPLLATSYLSLYQSCSVSRYCHDLLKKVLRDSTGSRLSSLLNQETVLRSCDNHMSVAAENNRTNLQTDYQAYKRLQVSSKHLELLTHVHCDTRVIVLQHSNDMDKLYVGYLVPPQPPVVIKKGQPLSDKVSGPVPSVNCIEVCNSDLLALKELMLQYHTDVKVSLQNPEAVNEEMIKSSFDSIVDGLESYLEEVTKQISDCLSKEDVSKELTIVLLVDVQLMEFPIETLQFLQQFKKNTIVSISRDLSLQFLAYRIVSMKETGESGSEEDAKKKSDKYQAQPDSFAVNTTSIKYILDPRADLKMSDGVKKVIQEFSKITAKWSELSGNIGPSDWFDALTTSNGVFIVCSENILSHFAASQLASANLPNCTIAVIEDQIRTNASFHTQSKLDIIKSVEELQYETSAVAVILLSLAGVNCIVMNQWYCSIEDGAQAAERILKELLSKPLKSGQIHLQAAQEDNSDDSNNILKDCKTLIKLVYGLPHLTLS